MNTTKDNNSGGFSLVGLMVASGLMVGLSLVLAQMSKQQILIQKKSEMAMDIALLTQKTVRVLQDKQACLNTVGEGVALASGNTIPISRIQDGNGRDIIVKSDSSGVPTYGDGTLKVIALDLTDIVVNGEVGDLNLRVTFEKMGKAARVPKRSIKKFPLSVELTPSGQVRYCTSHLDAAVSAAVREVCPDLGGTYDSNIQSCTSALANKKCPTGQYMTGFDEDMNLLCASPPPSNPHFGRPVCYLLTTYNNGSYLGAGGDSPWRLIVAGSNPIHSSLVFHVASQNTGSDSADFIDNVKATCRGDGYSDQFRSIIQSTDTYRLNLILHYCCRHQISGAI